MAVVSIKIFPFQKTGQSLFQPATIKRTVKYYSGGKENIKSFGNEGYLDMYVWRNNDNNKINIIHDILDKHKVIINREIK